MPAPTRPILAPPKFRPTRVIGGIVKAAPLRISVDTDIQFMRLERQLTKFGLDMVEGMSQLLASHLAELVVSEIRQEIVNQNLEWSGGLSSSWGIARLRRQQMRDERGRFTSAKGRNYWAVVGPVLPTKHNAQVTHPREGHPHAVRYATPIYKGARPGKKFGSDMVARITHWAYSRLGIPGQEELALYEMDYKLWKQKLQRFEKQLEDIINAGGYYSREMERMYAALLDQEPKRWHSKSGFDDVRKFVRCIVGNIARDLGTKPHDYITPALSRASSRAGSGISSSARNFLATVVAEANRGNLGFVGREFSRMFMVRGGPSGTLRGERSYLYTKGSIRGGK